MTYEKRNGPAGNRAAAHTSSKAWTDKDFSAARRRRHEQAQRLEPIRCSACGAWLRDPLAHTCNAVEQRLPIIEWCEIHGPVVGWCPFIHCGCEGGEHDSSTCAVLGELTPRRWCR